MCEPWPLNPRAPAGPRPGLGSPSPRWAGLAPQSPLLRPPRDASHPAPGRGPQLWSEQDGGVCPRRGPAAVRGHGRLIGRALRDQLVRIIRRGRPLPVPGSQRPALEAPADWACRPRVGWGWEERRGAGVGRGAGRACPSALRPPPRALQAAEAPPASWSRVPLRTAPRGGGEARPSEGCVRGGWVEGVRTVGRFRVN